MFVVVTTTIVKVTFATGTITAVIVNLYNEVAAGNCSIKTKPKLA